MSCPLCHERCGLCRHCHAQPIPAGNRCYCAECSPRASLLWKQRFRAVCRARGQSYRYDWKDPEARRAYHRAYMRRWRARRRRGGDGGMPRIALATAVLAALCLAGAPGAHAGTAGAAEPICAAVLVDRSGSYQGIEVGRRLAGATVAQLEAGDSVLVRWISAESYDPKELVLDRTLPGVAGSSNQFNTHERVRIQAAHRALRGAKRELLLLLHRAPIARSGATDVWGAIRAAMEWKAALGCTRTSFIVISDLEHNRNESPPLRLHGVEILVAGFEHGADFARTERLRAGFTRRAAAAGARVRFLPPGRVPALRDDGAPR